MCHKKGIAGANPAVYQHLPGALSEPMVQLFSYVPLRHPIRAKPESKDPGFAIPMGDSAFPGTCNGQGDAGSLDIHKIGLPGRRKDAARKF